MTQTNADSKSRGPAKEISLLRFGPSSPPVFIPAAFLPPFPKGGETPTLRKLTEAEVRLGRLSEIPTPWAYRALEATAETWLAVPSDCKVARDENGINAVWVDQIYHIRMGKAGRKPSLWRSVRDDESRRVPGWAYGPVRKRLRDLPTTQVELILGGGVYDAAIVFEDEVVISTSFTPEGRRPSPTCFIVGQDILANVSRLSRGERHRGKKPRHNHAPQPKAEEMEMGDSPRIEGYPVHEEPEAVKQTAAESGWAPAGGRPIPAATSLPPAGTTLALPAPKPAAAKQRVTPAATRVVNRPVLASAVAGGPSEESEPSAEDSYPELSHFRQMAEADSDDDVPYVGEAD